MPTQSRLYGLDGQTNIPPIGEIGTWEYTQSSNSDDPRGEVRSLPNIEPEYDTDMGGEIEEPGDDRSN